MSSENHLHKTGYKGFLDTGVGNVGYTLIRLAPIMAAIPAMLSLLRSADYSAYAWFLVGGVELTGYALGELTVRALQKKVITWKQALWPLGIYGLVIEGLLLGYDVIPAWANWYEEKIEVAEVIRSSVSVLLPFFTLTGAGMLAIHDYLEQITADEEYTKEVSRQRDGISWQDDRAFKLAERELKLNAKASRTVSRTGMKLLQPVSNTGESDNSFTNNGFTQFHETDNETVPATEPAGKRIVRYLIENPGAMYSDIASYIGKSEATVSREVKPLIETGVLHANKQGKRTILTVNGNHKEYLAS